MASRGTEPKVIPLQSHDDRLFRSKSVEDFVLSRVGPSTLKAESFSQAGLDSGRAVSLPSGGQSLSKASIRTDRQGGPVETDKMGAVRPTNPRLQPRRGDPGGFLSSKRGREPGSHVPRLREHDLLRKEVQLTRGRKAVPSMVPASVYPSRKVNSYEKTVRVLGDSDNRRHIPYQGHKISGFPSVKERSVLYLSHAAAIADHPSGLTELNFVHKISSNSLDNQKAKQARAKEECAVCSQPVYLVERMTIQNIPLHRTCFCCHRCGRKLSLVNYAIASGKFYCKVHDKLLSEVKGKNQEENFINSLKQQQQKRARQQNPGPVPKNGNHQVGKILTREKIQPRLSGLYPEVGQTRSQRNETASWSKSRTTWPPLNKATGYVTHGSGRTKKLLPDTMVILHSWNKAERSFHKAPEDKPIGDKSAPVEKQSQLPRFQKSGEDVLHQIRRLDGNRNLEVLEKRQLLMIKNIHDDQARKEGLSISEKAMMFQHNELKLKEKVPMVSPLTSIPPKLSSFGLFSSRSEPHRTTKGMHLPATEVAVADGSRLTSTPFDGKFSRSSSSKGKRSEKQMLRRAEPLPDTIMNLPAMTSPENRQKKQLPETNQSNRVITLGLEDTNTLSHINAETKEGHSSSQMKPEASVDPPAWKEVQKVASSPDSPNIHFTDGVSCQALAGRDKQTQILYSESLERPDNQLYPQTHCREAEVSKEKEMQAGRKSDSREILNLLSDQASQATRLEKEDTCSAEEAEWVGTHSVSSSKGGGAGKMGTFRRNDLQDTHWACNTSPITDENLETIKMANSNGELPRKVSSENNVQLKSQEDLSGETTIFQASRPPAKEPKAPKSCEIPYLTEYQVTGDVKVDTKKKQPLKKERTPFPCFFASKTRGIAPKEPPATETKKALKIQSALVTLFGYSSDKEKNEKQQPAKALSQPSAEAGDESRPQVVCSSNLPKPGSSKKAEVPEMRTLVTKSEGDLQDSEEGKTSRDGQRENLPSLDSEKAFRVNTPPVERRTDFSSSVLPAITNAGDPKRSDLNMEPPLRNQSKSSLSPNFQTDLTAPGKTLQSSTKSLEGITSGMNPLVEISSKINVASRGGLYDQGLRNFPSLEDHDLELKAGNISLLSPSGESKVPLLDRDHRIPDMLLFSAGARVPVNSQEGEPQHTPHWGTKNKDRPLPETGNPVLFQHSDPQFCLQSSTDNPDGLDLCGEHVTTNNYPTRGDDFPSLPAPLRHIPELLRDTIQSKAENRDVAMGRPQEDPL